MSRTTFPRYSLCALAGLLIAGLFLLPSFVLAAAPDVHRIVVLGDPHIPGRYLDEKKQVIDTINGWQDVSLVVAVGDITEELGSRDEYRSAKQFFSRLAKPFIPIPGNHDYIYADTLMASGKKRKADAYGRDRKLSLFQKTFGLPDRYFTRTMGAYLLVFLATDGLHEPLLAKISDAQMMWLGQTLTANRTSPTILFFHAPLKGTLRDYNENANTEHFVAQPSDRIETLLKANPQVMLWVSGHTHTSPKEESFAAELNRLGQVTNIHTTDMNRKNIWTNSLFLHPDRIVVRTYNHAAGAWVSSLDRSLSLPAFLIRR